MAQRIAKIKDGRSLIGGYYKIEDESHDYEIRLNTTDQIHGEPANLKVRSKRALKNYLNQLDT